MINLMKEQLGSVRTNLTLKKKTL